MDNGHLDSVEQIIIDQVSCYEVHSKTSNIIDIYEKFDAIYSMMFVEEIFVVNDPYGFRLLVIGNDIFVIFGFVDFVKCNMHINLAKYKSF